MAKDSSFDVVSEVNMQEVDNAFQQTTREISQRYDLKDSGATIELSKGDKLFTINAPADFVSKQIIDVLSSKLIKRGIDLKAVSWDAPQAASGGTVRVLGHIVEGIDQATAKKINKDIKDQKLKVKVTIEADKLRVSSASKDALQTVIQFLRDQDYGQPLQFTNYRLYHSKGPLSNMDTPLGSVLYITLGCAKNEVDTDRMRSLLTAAGYEEAFDPQDADIAIVNTCSFLASATSESIETTLELANEVQDGVRSCPIVMCGCVPSRYGDDLPDELPEVAAFVKADEEDGIVAIIDGVLGVEREIAAYIPQVKRTVEGAVAYVKISDGCNRFCSFCMIPYIRGRYHSRNAESIISEVRDLVAGGVREIVLIGQDTGIWGTDFADEDVADGSPRNLAQLLRAVAEAVRPHNVWVRVLYLQPEGMTDELIETIRDTPEVLPYIDIPVQHCDARILKAMRRSGSRQELEDLFRDLRERIPGIVIRSTAMVGFPTETDDEFRDLIDFMDTVGFDYTSVFAYSQEEGSLAAKMEGQVDEEVKLERAQEAMDLAESLGFAATAAHVGERAQVIVDGIEETEDGAELIGHAWFQAPDSDGAVHLDASEASVGDILTVEFTDSFCYELIGHVVE